MVKIPWGISDTYRQKSGSFVHSSCLPEVSVDKTARQLWWTSQELSPAGIIITMAVHAHISPGGWTIGLLATHPTLINQSINQETLGDHTESGKISFSLGRCLSGLIVVWEGDDAASGCFVQGWNNFMVLSFRSGCLCLLLFWIYRGHNIRTD
jgi:hypothetical protein